MAVKADAHGSLSDGFVDVLCPDVGGVVSIVVVLEDVGPCGATIGEDMVGTSCQSHDVTVFGVLKGFGVNDSAFLAIFLVGDAHGALLGCVKGFQWGSQWDEVAVDITESEVTHMEGDGAATLRLLGVFTYPEQVVEGDTNEVCHGLVFYKQL